MKKPEIEDRIKYHFQDDVPDVLDSIKSSPQFVVPEQEPKWNWNILLSKRSSLVLTSLFIIALVIFGVRNNTSSPVVASTITMDVNPSIEITLDEDDFVIDVTALNDDGDEVVSRDITYLGMTLDEVIDVLVTRLGERGYIANIDEEDNIILIDVSATNETIRARVEQSVKQYLGRKLEQFESGHWILSAGDIQLTPEQRQAVLNAMKDNPMTRAKLILVYRIHALDESYTIQSLSRLNVRQLYQLFIELEDPDNLPYYDQMPGHQDQERDPHGQGQSAVIF